MEPELPLHIYKSFTIPLPEPHEPNHALPFYHCKINFKIIFPSALQSFECCLSL